MLLKPPWASCALYSFFQGNSRKSTTHWHRRRAMITAVVTDWQLSPVSSTSAAETLKTEEKRAGYKRGIICFLPLLYHLRQVRRLCIPNGPSIRAYRWSWRFQASEKKEFAWWISQMGCDEMCLYSRWWRSLTLLLQKGALCSYGSIKIWDHEIGRSSGVVRPGEPTPTGFQSSQIQIERTFTEK